MAEWENVHSMLKDMSRFARENPEHRFLCADNLHGATIGFVAFREDPDDEQMQEWSIKVLFLRQQWDNELRRSLGSAGSRLAAIDALVREARAEPVPVTPVVPTGPRKTRWDLIDFD